MVAMEGIVVVDNNNHRIMRQSKGSTEGSVVVVIEGTEEDSPEFP
jgi:shikimate kinase